MQFNYSALVFYYGTIGWQYIASHFMIKKNRRMVLVITFFHLMEGRLLFKFILRLLWNVNVIVAHLPPLELDKQLRLPNFSLYFCSKIMNGMPMHLLLNSCKNCSAGGEDSTLSMTTANTVDSATFLERE
ncbi:hypothetical protein Cni_G20964 [Canna indica]|uniref:Uncharacterized protein n=1 Tax=Canna indica TaxID=4628 RepID=A0AAQ3KPW0_9LILI|nr:hypothetical protein Cni_G20964 [Canna indica]